MDDLETAQRFSLSNYGASLELCTSTKRQRISENPLQFDSPEPGPSEVDLRPSQCRTDTAVFPSDLSSPVPSLDISPIYPSEESESRASTGLEGSAHTDGYVSSEIEGTATFQRGLTPDMALVTPTYVIESSSDCSFGSPAKACQYNNDELDQVANVLVSSCCSKECLFHLTAHNVITVRRKFWSLGRCAQRQWLTDRLDENSCEEEKGKLTTTYSIAGINVCRSSWCKVYMVSQRRISRVLKSVQHGKVVIEHGNKGK